MRRLFLGTDDRLRSGWVLVIYSAIALFVTGLLSTLVDFAHLEPKPPYTLDDPHLVFSGLTVLIAGLAATAPLMLFAHQRAGLSPQHLLTKLAFGVVVGALAVTVAIVVPALGTLHCSGLTASALFFGGVQQQFTMLPTGVGEELLLRGIPLRALARGTHRVVAVLLTASVFGLLHLNNPEASWVAVLNVALVGVWFGAIAIRTDSLWPSVGAHLAWNWFEGFVWGQPVSGIQPGRALFTSAPMPYGFWSGGPFGPEASEWTALVLVGATAITVLWPRARSRSAAGSVQR